MKRQIYEWIDHRGRGVVSDWDIQEEQQARLDQRLDMLRIAEVNPQSGQVELPQRLLGGPMKAIYELKIHGRVALRPHLCLGPLDRLSEWTVLVAAIEKGNKLQPLNAPELAEERRQQVIRTNGQCRKRWRDDDDLD